MCISRSASGNAPTVILSRPGTKAMQKEYEEALLAEIDAAEETAESEVISVFFGGGTPSAVDAGMLARVMEKLRSKYIFRGC